MKREIKFRVWDGEKMHKVYWLELYTETHSYLEDDRCVSYNGNNLMQSTGLKDETGKEIYEGDIIKMGMDKDTSVVRVIEWKDGSFWCCRIDSETIFPLHTLNFNESNDWNIVGNIYENKELL